MMNKEIKHLYAELSPANKQQLQLEFQQSPKMLLYLALLDKIGFVSTPKAITTIYEKEKNTVEDKILINRFYKLRSKLHLQLLNQMKDHPNSLTKEEKELAFLRLLVIKNEYQDALKKLKVLEQKCWDDNLFELLPEVIRLIHTSIHSHQPNNIKALTSYFKKAELVNELFYALQQFKNYIASFGINYYASEDYLEADLFNYYKSTMNKMRRKARAFKEYPRLTLIYHYTAFSIGCQIGTTTADISNILARHLNKLKKLLDAHPNMPLDLYIPHHRVFNLDFLYQQEAMIWFHKNNAKKSHQCILNSKNLRTENPHIYIRNLTGTLHNIVLCCWGAKQYETAIDYIEEIKEFQITNDSVKTDIPYYIYETINYVGLYPKIKHSTPKELIRTVEQFLKTTNENDLWIYEAIGSFSLLYGFYEKSLSFLEHPPLVATYRQQEITIYALDVLKLVMANDQLGLRKFINKTTQLKKGIQQRNIILHLDDLKKLAEQF